MQALSLPARRRTAFGTLFVVLALLFAQWLGLAHRIEHSGVVELAMQSPTNSGMAQADVKVDKSLDHSCALFDAAALATVLNSPAIVPALLPAACVLALWQAFVSWDAPFVSHFSSRAPPSC